MKILGGHSEGDIENYHKNENSDYEALSESDRKVIDKIDNLLRKLSEQGRDYWETYYS